MKKFIACLLVLAFVLSGCSFSNQELEGVQIELSNIGITVDGSEITNDNTQAVFAANDIVFYLAGQDFTYGEGSEDDAHEQSEADKHTVVHITKPGRYVLQGELSLGQIAVDLGEDAKEDPNATVTLVLNNVDITCKVAPAIIFYNVYECGNSDAKTATKDVDTSSAGANVLIADESVNNINGSYVARIYKPDTVVLNSDKTQVEDAQKLHKYDGAFYSKMSINVNGGKKGTGVLNITAENEGLDSELHLTVNGGIVNIKSGNDGINTNEDNVSVTTVNGGEVNIEVTGETGEGDGIDSNGWLVINGGKVTARACSSSADSGIDSDKGIHINGGTVIATGSMLDRIEDGGQTYAVFNFKEKQKGTDTISLKNDKNKSVFLLKSGNAYSVLLYSSPELAEGTYTLWSGKNQFIGQSGGFMSGGMFPSGRPNKGEQFEGSPQFEDGQSPEVQKYPQGGKNPFAGEFPEGFTPPEGNTPPEQNGGERPQMPNFGSNQTSEASAEFIIQKGANTFSNVSYKA